MQEGMPKAGKDKDWLLHYPYEAHRSLTDDRYPGNLSCLDRAGHCLFRYLNIIIWIVSFLANILQCIAFTVKCTYNVYRMNKGGSQMGTVNFSCRLDKDVKLQSEAIYKELGLNLTTAINVFLKESLRAGGFPFDVRLNKPNRETIAAMMESQRIPYDPKVKKYEDVEEALAELKR